MTPIFKKAGLLLCAAALCATGRAQNADGGLWLDATVQKSVTKWFSVDAGIDLRLEDNFSTVTRKGFGVGLTFKPIKHVSLGLGYNFLHDYNLSETKEKYDEEDGDLKGYNLNKGYGRNKHRATFDVTGQLPVGRFTISVRERFQYTHFNSACYEQLKYRKEIAESSLGGYTGDVYDFAGSHWRKLTTENERKEPKNRYYLRSRFGLEYNIRHCNWTPYATYEFSNDLSNGMNLDKMRLTAGVEWKITKQHRLDFAYVFNNGQDDDDAKDSHILSIGYKFKF